MNDNLENTVKDAYIIYFDSKTSASSVPLQEAELQQRYDALIQKAGELQQRYGSEAFNYRTFDPIKKIAAVIRDNSIIDALKSEGYIVEEQGIMRTQRTLSSKSHTE